MNQNQLPDIILDSARGEEFLARPVDPSVQPAPVVAQAPAAVQIPGEEIEVDPQSAEAPAVAMQAVRDVYGDFADMSPSEMLDPEQALAGIDHAVKAWRRSQLLFEMFHGAAQQQRRLPIMPAPLGELDPILGVPYVEVDWHVPLEEAYKASDAEAIQTYLTKVFRDMNNTYVANYLRDLSKLATYADISHRYLTDTETPDVKADTPYDELTAAIETAYLKYRPMGAQHRILSRSLATGTSPKDGEIPGLANMEAVVTALAAAGQNEAQQAAVVGNMYQQHLRLLREEMAACVQIMAAASKRAMILATANQRK